MSPESKTTTIDQDEQDEAAALNAQVKHKKAIATHHVEILKRIQRLEKIGGAQDYSYTILEALNAFGGEVNLSFLGQVLPDHTLLAQARKELAEQKKIRESAVKNRKSIILNDAAE